jgi:metal-dependent hydrolase (beta-lactamase superfamily II)
MGPFEHRRPQEPQQTTQTHPPVQKKPVPTESKEKTVIINGCDVTGCTTIAEAYEKNSGKIKFLLA